MPLLRLIAEGVGPFERLDVDLSDGKGNPHLGPHIFAGVNGSGKSTLLRTLAWVMDRGQFGFPYDDWSALLEGYPRSNALVAIRLTGGSANVWAATKGTGEQLTDWAQRALSEHGLPTSLDLYSSSDRGLQETNSFVMRRVDRADSSFNIAAYSPSKSLKYWPNPDLTRALSDPREKCLAFESTVQNESIQAWLLSLYSKRAIARERRQSGDEYAQSLGRFETALQLVYGEKVSFEVEIEPSFQPRLRLAGQSLNFSQLPDGVRSTVAWIADFMMRQDLVKWDRRLGGKRPGIILLDEIDAHLHPLWQRRLLPAMREALPDVQILVTSHSPFVISSCPGSRVHVLEMDKHGHAHARPPVDSPIGESVTTTLKEIFGVDSRFDVLTERQLEEWNELKRREASGSLSTSDSDRIRDLTITLSERSEELRSIVAAPLTIPQSVLRSLQGEGVAKKKKRA
jgi:AAA domain, putative AbiEii toxin, Type IV TA system